MTENPDASPTSGTPPAAETPRERTGEFLRREREKRQISIETIASKLRLNAKFIRAIEDSQFDELPGDAYVRVYLRSLSNFLSLNSEELFRRFFEERGLTGADTLKKDLSTKINLTVKEKEKPNTTLIITVVLISLLALISVIANRQGWLASHSEKAISAKIAKRDSAAQKPTAATVDSSAMATKPSRTDSSPAVKPLKRPDTVKPEVKQPTQPDKVVMPSKEGKPADSLTKMLPRDAARDSVTKQVAFVRQIADSVRKQKPVESKPADKPAKVMKLGMIVTGDSCWLRVFSDGVEWRNTLTKGKGIYFTAKDSFNIHVGVNEGVAFTLDGKPVILADQKGVVSCKIDHSGVTLWSLDKWNAVFKGRF